MIIRAIKSCLENMDKKFVGLSRLKFNEINDKLKEKLQGQKIQERPFAYEFYHQFRKMWDCRAILGIISEDVVIQAEVNKSYQYIPHLNKMPDFLLNKPTADENFAVIEFKMGSNIKGLRDDLEKLVAFKQTLQYSYLIQVVIGDKNSLKSAMSKITKLNNSDGEEIVIIMFNTDLWRANDYRIKYKRTHN